MRLDARHFYRPLISPTRELEDAFVSDYRRVRESEFSIRHTRILGVHSRYEIRHDRNRFLSSMIGESTVLLSVKSGS